VTKLGEDAARSREEDLKQYQFQKANTRWLKAKDKLEIGGEDRYTEIINSGGTYVNVC